VPRAPLATARSRIGSAVRGERRPVWRLLWHLTQLLPLPLHPPPAAPAAPAAPASAAASAASAAAESEAEPEVEARVAAALPPTAATVRRAAGEAGAAEATLLRWLHAAGLLAAEAAAEAEAAKVGLGQGQGQGQGQGHGPPTPPLERLVPRICSGELLCDTYP
jgi:hypothetical protein